MTVNMSISVEGNNNQSRFKKRKKKTVFHFRQYHHHHHHHHYNYCSHYVNFIVATSDDEELGKGIILFNLIRCIWSLTIE